MSKNDLWCIIFANVVAMRLHPKNDTKGDVTDALIIAREAADRGCECGEKYLT